MSFEQPDMPGNIISADTVSSSSRSLLDKAIHFLEKITIGEPPQSNPVPVKPSQSTDASPTPTSTAEPAATTPPSDSQTIIRPKESALKDKMGNAAPRATETGRLEFIPKDGKPFVHAFGEAHPLNHENPVVNTQQLPPNMNFITTVAKGFSDVIKHPVKFIRNIGQRHLFMADVSMEDPKKVFDMSDPEIQKDITKSEAASHAVLGIKASLLAKDVSNATNVAEQSGPTAGPSVVSKPDGRTV